MRAKIIRKPIIKIMKISPESWKRLGKFTSLLIIILVLIQVFSLHNGMNTIIAEQNQAEQAQSDQSKAGQEQPEQSRIPQDQTEEGQIEQDQADKNQTEQDRNGQLNTRKTDDYRIIAQNSKFELYFNEKYSSLAVKNRISGYIWYSSALHEQFDTTKLNKKLLEEIQSLFIINYTNIKTGDGSVISTSLVSSNPDMAFEGINNGIKGTYYFKDIGIGFDVEITLDDSGLKIKIPGDSIIEETDMKLVKIKMMPYFGASTDEQEGYFFYPDGSGAIMEFTDLTHFGENEKLFSVYGTDISSVFSRNTVYEHVMLPVYGVKKGNDAFLAIIEEGDEISNISVRPSNNILRLNSISCEFVYRNSFNDARVKSRLIKQYDRDIYKSDCTVKYMFLDGENADYSGMANCYREYLISNNKISKQIKKDDRIPLGLDIFMGITERGMLFNNFICTTNFMEAQDMLQELLNLGVTSIQTRLKGWTKKGYNGEPVHFPPNNKLGGKSGLKRLAEFARNNNIGLFLEVSPIFARSLNGGFSKRNDVVYLGNGTILTDADQEYFVLSPGVVFNKFNKSILPEAQKYFIAGISFNDLGRYLYYDYNKDNFTVKKQTRDYWIEIISKSKKELGGAMVSGGNLYVLNEVQRLAEIPMECSGNYFTTKSVPFYQMVVHGLIPYTSDVAGNLSPNLEREKLEWIEKGYMPYFELTYESADLLKYTQYNTLFTSTYTDWIQKARDIYIEFNENLGDIWSEYIVKHEELEEDIIMVSYSNGTRVIINYSDKDVKFADITVGAMDYLVIREGDAK